MGFLVHLNQVVRDYNSFLEKINEIMDKIKYQTKSNAEVSVMQLIMTSTSDMIENIRDSLLTHNAFNDRSYNYSLIRPYLKYLISENLKIKLSHQFKEIGLLKDSQSIIFTNRSTFDDYISILRKLNVLDEVTCNTLSRIYSWGNRSLHMGQHVPLHIIWMSIWYLFGVISDKMVPNIKSSEEKITCIFNDLTEIGKQKIEIIDGTFIPSKYDIL